LGRPRFRCAKAFAQISRYIKATFKAQQIESDFGVCMCAVFEKLAEEIFEESTIERHTKFEKQVSVVQTPKFL